MLLQLGLIYDSGEEGIVLRAQCKKKGLPNPERVYAMKVLTNFFASQTATQVSGLATHTDKTCCTVIYTCILKMIWTSSKLFFFITVLLFL